jgi:hypothetical protein
MNTESVNPAQLLELDLDMCHLYDVHYMFKQVYPFYVVKDVSPYVIYLIGEVCLLDMDSEHGRWPVFLRCVRHEKRRNEEGEKQIWVLQPETPSQMQVADLEALERLIVVACRKVVSPCCFQHWKIVPAWCKLVKTAFGKWRKKLPFEINERRIYSDSILARLSEENFERVKTAIDVAVEGGNLRNWNHFACTLLKECHKHHDIGEHEEYDDDSYNVIYDFNGDKDDEYYDPDFTENRT